MFRLLLWINASPAPPSSVKQVGCGVGAGTQHSLCLVGEKLSAGWGLESDTRVGIPTTLQACPDTRVSRAHTGTCMHTRASHRHTRACTVTLERLPQCLSWEAALSSWDPLLSWLRKLPLGDPLRPEHPSGRRNPWGPLPCLAGVGAPGASS